MGDDWQKMDGALVQVSCGLNGKVVGVNAGGNAYYRMKLTADNLSGTSWSSLGAGYRYISMGIDGQIWAVRTDGSIQFRGGITDKA